MSPRKLTEDDKQEILYQYRNSEATTSTLAQSFEVSSSTISRFLKNNLSTVEYEDLIQQKRLARTPRGEKSSSKANSPAKGNSDKSNGKSKPQKKSKSTTKRRKSKAAASVDETFAPELAPAENLQLELATESNTAEDNNSTAEGNIESKTITTRRRRRRSTGSQSADKPADPISSKLAAANDQESVVEAATVSREMTKDTVDEPEAEIQVKSNNLDAATVSQSDEREPSDRPILKSDRLDSDEDEDTMDIITLKEMLGEDLEDINDEEDEEDEDDWEEDAVLSYSTNKSELNDINVLPLSQAALPRTCYLVIDRAAELIVKPLADFADLGIIPDTEIQQRTLPVFDNHRIAKRFSHRRERVIKVPDGQMLQKTSHYLQGKGITRLLIDGQIYSLTN